MVIFSCFLPILCYSCMDGNFVFGRIQFQKTLSKWISSFSKYRLDRLHFRIRSVLHGNKMPFQYYSLAVSGLDFQLDSTDSSCMHLGHSQSGDFCSVPRIAYCYGIWWRDQIHFWSRSLHHNAHFSAYCITNSRCKLHFISANGQSVHFLGASCCNLLYCLQTLHHWLLLLGAIQNHQIFWICQNHSRSQKRGSFEENGFKTLSSSNSNFLDTYFDWSSSDPTAFLQSWLDHSLLVHYSSGTDHHH